MDHREALSIHDREHSFALVYEGSVENEVAISRAPGVGKEWRPLQPMLDDPSESRNTVTALRSQLSERVALGDPTLEPDPLAQMLVVRVFPPKGATTPSAKPALGSVPASPIASDLATTTPRTVLFLSSQRHHC